MILNLCLFVAGFVFAGSLVIGTIAWFLVGARVE